MKTHLSTQLRREQKLEGTKSSLHAYLNAWVRTMNSIGWRRKRLSKRYMRSAFVPVFIETAYILLRIDHPKSEALEILSRIVNDVSDDW